MTSSQPARLKFQRVALIVAVVVVFTAIVVALRVSVFTTTYSDGVYAEFAMFNLLPPLVIAIAMRLVVSPNRRNVWMSAFILIVLVITGIIQEYLVARHIALVMGMNPSDAPLLPNMTQLLSVMAGNIRAISFVLIGVFTGTLLTLLVGNLKPDGWTPH